jgi:hypothetical protein
MFGRKSEMQFAEAWQDAFGTLEGLPPGWRMEAAGRMRARDFLAYENQMATARMMRGGAIKERPYLDHLERWKRGPKSESATAYLRAHWDEVVADCDALPRCRGCGTVRGLHTPDCPNRDQKNDNKPDGQDVADLILAAVNNGDGWTLVRLCLAAQRDPFEAFALLERSAGWNIRANDGFHYARRQAMAITKQFTAGEADYGRYPVRPDGFPDDDGFDLAGADSTVAQIAAKILDGDGLQPLDISPSDFAAIDKMSEMLFITAIAGSADSFHQGVAALNAVPVSKGNHDAGSILKIIETTPNLTRARLETVRALRH